MRKTKSKTVAEWVASKNDPDVSFLIRPLKYNENQHIRSEATYVRDDKFVSEGGLLATLTIMFALLDIRGITNREDGSPFKLTFRKYKMGSDTNIQVVSDEVFELIDSDLLDEISNNIWNKTNYSPEEIKDTVFTQDSSTITCPNATDVQGMSQIADSGSETEPSN